MSFRWLWPEIVDQETAANAAKQGYQAAFVVAAFTGAIALVTTAMGPVMGFDAWATVDAILMAVTGWRIMRKSRAWALFGLVYWTGNLIFRLLSSEPGGGGIVAIILLLAFINGVRGTFKSHHYSKVPVLDPALEAER